MNAGSKMKLLIVDDEKYIRDSLCGGYDWPLLGFDEVFAAKDANEALNILDNNEITVVITDIRMPKLSGMDLIEQISMRRKDIKIIIISGYSEFEYARQALKYGVSDYLLKPARIETIAEAVRKAVKSLDRPKPVNVSENEEDYTSVLKKEFLYKLLFDAVASEAAIKNGIERYNLQVLKKPFYMAVFTYSAPDPKEWNLPSDMWLIKLGIINILTEFCDGRYYSTIFDDRHGHIIMLFAVPEETLKEKILGFCGECCDIVNKSLKIPDISVIISEICGGASDIHGIYNKTIQFIDDFAVGTASRIIFADDITNMKNKELTNKAKAYVESHISENITVYSTAQIVHLSPNYFSAVFKQCSGMNFIVYVNMMKVNKAKKYLTTTDMPVSEVAYALGYTDVKYFARVFKKYTHMTPAAFRKSVTRK